MGHFWDIGPVCGISDMKVYTTAFCLEGVHSVECSTERMQCYDGWVDGWMGGWMGEWVDGQMDG